MSKKLVIGLIVIAALIVTGGTVLAGNPPVGGFISLFGNPPVGGFISLFGNPPVGG